MDYSESKYGGNDHTEIRLTENKGSIIMKFL